MPVLANAGFEKTHKVPRLFRVSGFKEHRGQFRYVIRTIIAHNVEKYPRVVKNSRRCVPPVSAVLHGIAFTVQPEYVWA